MHRKSILALCGLAMLWNFATSQNPTAALCSQVRRMNQVCFPEEPVGCLDCAGRIGKSGPQGLRGPPGRNAEVDYDRINERIDDRINHTMEGIGLSVLHMYSSIHRK